MTDYTEEDFRVARFAEHPDGDFAARLYAGLAIPWFDTDECAYADVDMARSGWVPVQSRPTITESELSEAIGQIRGLSIDDRYRSLLGLVGIPVVADPEPTNAERLERLYKNWSQSNRNPPFGEWADSVGVTAPEEPK